MKRITILCLFLSSHLVYADTVITESVEGHGRNSTITLKLKGDKIRLDSSSAMSIITDTATGDSITLMHPQKSFMKLSGEKQRAMMELGKKFMNAASPAATPAGKPKIVDTGKSEKVGNYNAEIYTMDTPSSHFTFWVTKDIPNYAELQDQLKKVRAMTGNLRTAAGAVPDTGEMQGLPVKTQIDTKGQTMTITVDSVEDKSIDDSEMAPPAGYSEISMPDFGGAGLRHAP